MTRDPIAPWRRTNVARTLKGAMVNPGGGARKAAADVAARPSER